MTALTPPAMDAPPEEWGRLAVSLPDWRWMPGMLNRKNGTRYMGPVMRNRKDASRYMGRARWAWDDPVRHHAQGIADDDWPDPDDPATAGCLLALLGPSISMTHRPRLGVWWVDERPLMAGWSGTGTTLGRACIAAAAANGRWPGGDS
jgi:hypothetical protein